MHMKGCDIAIELCIDWGDCSMCVCVALAIFLLALHLPDVTLRGVAVVLTLCQPAHTACLLALVAAVCAASARAS